MTRKIHKHALAESDLIGIWAYSFNQWDEVQADKYLDELDRGVRLLADNPELGSKRDRVREGYRELFINHHAIYYTVTPTTIHVYPCASRTDGPGQAFADLMGRRVKPTYEGGKITNDLGQWDRCRPHADPFWERASLLDA